MLTILSDPLAIPIYGIALYVFIIWRVISSIPSRDPRYAERICRILNRFKNEQPTRLISRFFARAGIQGTTFAYMPRIGGAPGHMLLIWINDNEYAFIEDGEWKIYYED